MILRSLSARLLVALVAVQTCAIILAMLAFPLVVPFDSYSDIAEDTFRAKIAQAIEPGPSGELRIVRTPDLERYVAARRGATFAVMMLSDGKILSGRASASNSSLSCGRSMRRWRESSRASRDSASTPLTPRMS